MSLIAANHSPNLGQNLYQNLRFIAAETKRAIGFLISDFLYSYSKRRISTGNSLAASLAGTIVASTAMHSAAVAIHIPSQKLG